MTKSFDWRVSFSLWAFGALLMIVCLPRAQAANFNELPSVGSASFTFSLSDLPRAEPIQISSRLKTFGELLDRLELLDEADAPANIVAALRTASVVSTTEFPLDDAIATAVDATGMSGQLAINSEAPEACRANGVARGDYNYGAVAESECTCELYQRNPAARSSSATAKEFHWVKSCKKARYKAG
jgi:hypothetical protein